MWAGWFWAAPVLWASVNVPPASIDVQTAIERAVARNQALARSRSGVEGQQLAVRSAKARFGITIRPLGGIDATADRQRWDYGVSGSKRLPWGTEVGLTGRVANRGDEELDGEDTEEIRLGVELSQPLFQNFGPLIELESIRLADSQWVATQRAYERQKADLVVELVEVMELIVRLHRQIETDESFGRRIDKLVRLTRLKERQGRSTRVDTLRVELLRGQADSRLTNSREQLRVAEFNLAELLGDEVGTTYHVVPPPLIEVEEDSVDAALETALANRLDYAQALQDYQDRVRGVRIARRVLWPDLRLIGRYERVGSGETLADATALREDDWFFGLRAGREINVARDLTSIAQSEVDARTALQTIRLVEVSIARDVQQRLVNYRRSRTNLSVERRNLELAQQRVTLTRRLFEIGKGDNFSVTDAEQSLVDTRIEFLNARSNAAVAGYRLLRGLGTLVDYPEPLKPRPDQVLP
jgi:outer membrane protein TolC